MDPLFAQSPSLAHFYVADELLAFLRREPSLLVPLGQFLHAGLVTFRVVYSVRSRSIVVKSTTVPPPYHPTASAPHHLTTSAHLPPALLPGAPVGDIRNKRLKRE